MDIDRELVFSYSYTSISGTLSRRMASKQNFQCIQKTVDVVLAGKFKNQSYDFMTERNAR